MNPTNHTRREQNETDTEPRNAVTGDLAHPDRADRVAQLQLFGLPIVMAILAIRWPAYSSYSANSALGFAWCRFHA